MRVKIGDTWFDAESQPICIDLSDQDRLNIANMAEGCTKYAVFPDTDGMRRDEMLAWMSSGESEDD